MTTAPQVSVVVPTYQRRASVERLLRALTAQTLSPHLYEVVVSIDGSDDGTRELVQGLDAPYALHHVWDENRGRAAACNRGIAHAAGEVLVILDDDMEPAPDCLAVHLACHAEARRLGVLGAVPVVADANGSAAQAYVAAKFAVHLEKLARAGVEIGVRDFYSGHFSIRRDVLREVGGFDESFRAYGNEDVELAIRLKDARVRLVYAPAARARQHYEKDFRALARDTIAKGRTAVLCAAKHPEAVAAMRIATYAQASWRWRLARAALLRLTDVVPRVADVVIAGVTRLERRPGTDVDRLYRCALDYCFWLGARAARHAARRTGRGPALSLRVSMR